jgi:hypothetical protein
MTPQEELDLFTRLPANQLEKWLDGHEADAVKFLKASSDPVALARAQGKALFIDEMKKLLAKAKNLRQ